MTVAVPGPTSVPTRRGGWQALAEAVSLVDHWPRFAALLVLLWLCRGVALMCVLPPLEGWDEYQHVGRIVFVHDTGRSPVVGEDLMSNALIRQVIRLPLPVSAADQLKGTGAASYAAFWANGGRPGTPSIDLTQYKMKLYQSQHPPMYYALAAPVFTAAGGIEKLSNSTSVLRAVNLCLGATAVALVLAWIGAAVCDRRYATILAACVVLQPLYLLNIVRVANDALAVALGTGAIVCALWPTAFTARRAVVVGVLLGLSLLAKATCLALVPALLVSVLFRPKIQMTPKRTRLVHALIIVGLTVLISGWYFAGSFARYGMLTPMQEAVLNRAAGRTVWQMVTHHDLSIWPEQIWVWWFRAGVWVGGWSFLSAPEVLNKPTCVMMVVALVGWPVAALLRFKKPAPFFVTGDIAWKALLMILLMTAAMMFHGLQTLFAWNGSVATNPWYAAVVLPWFIALMVAGAARWPLKWIARLYLASLVLLPPAVETYGIWVKMLPAYTGLPFGPAAISRLASLHVSWLGTATLFVSTMLALGLAVMLVGASFSAKPADSIRTLD